MPFLAKALNKDVGNLAVWEQLNTRTLMGKFRQTREVRRDVLNQTLGLIDEAIAESAKVKQSYTDLYDYYDNVSSGNKDAIDPVKGGNKQEGVTKGGGNKFRVITIMVKVEINGQIVEFDSMPSDEDIDEAAKSIGAPKKVTKNCCWSTTYYSIYYYS